MQLNFKLTTIGDVLWKPSAKEIRVSSPFTKDGDVKSKILKRCLVAMGVGLCPVMLMADAPSVISDLLDEKVSRLDWGLSRMEESVRKVMYDNKTIGGIWVGVSAIYNPQTGRIEVLVQKTHAFNNKNDAELWCKSTLKALRRSLMIDPSTGKPVSSGPGLYGSSLYQQYFVPRGYTTKSQNEVEASALRFDNTVDIEVFSFYGTKTIHCKAPLLGTDVFISSE